MSSRPPPNLKGLAATKIELIKRIGAGCFGEVYKGKDKETDKDIAVKLEELNTPQLVVEYNVAKKLAGGSMEGPFPPGFALPCYFFENAGRHCALSMPLLGPTLEHAKDKCRGKFTPKTTMMLAEQVLRRLEYLHSLGLVHRDIKPENFMLGRGPTEHHVYLIDFGLCRAWHDGVKHQKYKERLNLTGTARYASLNAHRGIEQSRRDDLEASGHMLVYFLRGSMPWSGLVAKTQKEKFYRIAQVKQETPLDSLCQGLPACFKSYMETTRSLQYEQRPDYDSLRALYRNDFDAAGYKEDYDFDWYLSGPPLGLEPIGQWNPPSQPDDTKVTGNVSMPRTTSNASEKAEMKNKQRRRRTKEEEEEDAKKIGSDKSTTASSSEDCKCRDENNEYEATSSDNSHGVQVKHQWMWDGAKLFSRRLAKRNPLRWSKARVSSELAEDLENFVKGHPGCEGRPVCVAAAKGPERVFENTEKAIQWLRSDAFGT